MNKFEDLNPGDVFSINDWIYVKIHDILCVGDKWINAICLHNGESEFFEDNHNVTLHPRATLNLNP